MSSEIIFLPTPNWFVSQAVDLNERDLTLATCALNSIILTDPLFESYFGTIKEAHSKRLHAVSFYKIETFDYLASCSDDLEIKIWDYKSRCLINNHKFHQNSPTCLDWIRIESQEPILISCDIKGNIFKWNMNTNYHVRYFPENKPITQIKILENSYKTAVGYKTGTIVLLDSKSDQMNILAKLKTHEDSINCLFWCPKNLSDSSKVCQELKCDNLEHVLASSSEDKTIRIWDTLKSIQLKNFKIPSSGSKAAQKKTNLINYVALCWPKTNLILTGSFKGELFSIDLENLKSMSNSGNLVKWNHFNPLPDPQCHKKIIFEIMYFNEKVITLSLDRLLNTWCVNSCKQEKSLLTLNGFVYSVAFSPIDPNFMLVAVGDSSIKLMTNKHKVKSFCNNIKSEVTQIAWHPKKESLIAFGTKDGKVGIADIISGSKPASYIYTSFNQSVYTLVWSQDLLNTDPDENASKNINLYSVADGKIMLHYVQSIGKDSISPDNIKSTNFYSSLKKLLDEEETNSDYGLTEFSVLKIKNDGNFFCIGKFDGSIECYQNQFNKLTKICSLFNHQKLVTCIRWNVEEYDENLHEAVYMASGSNDFNVIIVDFKNMFEQLIHGSSKTNNLFSKFKFKLEGHKERITCLSWCKSSNHLLASCSYDSTVQIWNSENGQPVANFRGHSDKLLCCMFSNQNTNEVYSGGEDYCLYKWKIDEQEFKTPPQECPILFGKKKIKQIKKQTIGKKGEQETIAVDSVVNQEVDVLKSEVEIEKISEANEKIVKLVQPVVKSTIKSQKSTELKTLFTLCSSGNKSPKMKLNDCLVLYQNLIEKNKISNIDFEIFEFDKENFILNIFCNRSSSLNLLGQEQAELKRIGYEKWWIFEIWKGNLYKAIKELKESKQLNDLIISLYQSMISVANKSALELVNVYIEQMRSSGNSFEFVNKAIMHCCCTYQIQKALDICLEYNLYQYALCIAQIRLPPKNEIFNKILSKFAVYSTQVGDYETAVLCYIRLMDLENAYKTLLRRNTKNDTDFEHLLKTLSDKFKLFLKIE